MVKVLAASAIDMGEADVSSWFDGTRYSVTDSTYKLRGGDLPITFFGDGFEVNRKGQLVDGTVNKVIIGDKWDGVAYSGLAVDAALLVKIAGSLSLQDDALLMAKLLGKADKITGSDDDDFLDGQDGNDVLWGKDGSDDLTGGEGADQFRYEDQVESGFTGVDRILDFSQLDGDRIDVRHVADFDFIGYSETEGEASELRYYFDGGNTYVESDVSGNGFIFFKIRINGEVELTEADFIL